MSESKQSWPPSLWKASATEQDNLDCLEGDMETDLLIIGAGYTGLSCALHAVPGTNDVMVIDRAAPGWGCSGRNGGQINPQWKTPLDKLRQQYAGPDFERFLQILDQSASLVYELIDRHNIKCEILRGGSLIAGRGKRTQQYLGEWSQLWQSYGAEVEILDRAATAAIIGTGAYDLAMLDHRGGSLQPLSYALGLARACVKQGVTIFADTAAQSIRRDNQHWRVVTSRGEIRCNQLVIATNGYTDHLWPGLSKSIVPVASILTASEPLPDDIAARILPQRHPLAEFAGVPAYYRIDEAKRLIFGWRGTITGAMGRINTAHLRKKARLLFPALEKADWSYDWGGWVAITQDQRPQLLRLADNVYAGLGYNGRGITMATTMGKQLALLLEGRSTGIPVENLKPISLHRFYPIGVTTRILSGHLGDRLTSRNPT